MFLNLNLQLVHRPSHHCPHSQSDLTIYIYLPFPDRVLKTLARLSAPNNGVGEMENGRFDTLPIAIT